MKIRAKIKPNYLDDILKGKKDFEYRQVEELILTDGQRTLHTEVLDIRKESPKYAEETKRIFKNLPWDPELDIYAINIRPIRLEYESPGPWHIMKVRDIKKPEGVFKDIQPLEPEEEKQLAVEVMATQGIQLGTWHLQVVPAEEGMALMAENKEGGAIMVLCDGEVRISWDGPGALYEQKDTLPLPEQLDKAMQDYKQEGGKI